MSYTSSLANIINVISRLGGVFYLAWKMYGGVMKKKDLEKKLARLESVNDQLAAELDYIDRLMRLIGFSNGIHTIKATAAEIYDKDLGNINET